MPVKSTIGSPSKQIEYLTEPLTIEEMKAAADDEFYISGIVAVSACDMAHRFDDGFSDTISEKLTGSTLLMDVYYNEIGILDDGTALLDVSGDISVILREVEQHAE